MTDKIIEEHINKNLSLKDYLYTVLDWLGNISQRDESYIYHFEIFVNDLLEDYAKYAKSDFKFVTLGSSEDFFDNFKDVNKKGMIGRFYHQLLYPENEIIPVDKFMNLFPKEALMAELLYVLNKRKI